ncbi:ATP synthase subunit beta mitochondrial [Bienertia sinuspersici]
MDLQHSSSLETESSNPKTKLTQKPAEKLEPTPSSSMTDAKKRKRDDIEPMDEEEEVEATDDSIKSLEMEASKYVRGLFLDLDWCKTMKYVELMEVFDNQGLTNLMGVHGIDDIYPKAIHEFCENYGYAKGTTTSSVNVPNEGYDNYFKGKYNLKIGKVGKDEILTELGGKKGVNKIDHNSLSPLGKLLFNVVRRTVFPRTQKRGEASLLDCAVIYCLMFNVQINFPSLMISHMDRTVPSDLKVGYGTLLTKIFKSFKVPLEGYGKVGMKKEQYIQGSTLNGLNLGVLDGSTQWYTEILKMEEKNKREEEEKSKVRKSRRLISKSEGTPLTIDLEDEGVRSKEVEVLVPGNTEQLEQSLRELCKKQRDVEGQVVMMRQELSSFMLAFDKKHAEVMACLSEIRKAAGTQTEDVGTTPPKTADDGKNGTRNDEPAAEMKDQNKEVPIASVPTKTDTPEPTAPTPP